MPTTANVNAVAPAPAGNVTVAAGAQITSGKYGLIGLFGTNVTNSGTLSTDGGQVLMAAGEQVFLVPHSLDSGMIGLRAYVSALPNFYTTGIDDAVLFQKLAARTAQVGMVVRNDGLVEATAGNITIVGSTVQQDGIARAVTTLDSPGSIMIAGEDSTLSELLRRHQAARRHSRVRREQRHADRRRRQRHGRHRRLGRRLIASAHQRT